MGGPLLTPRERAVLAAVERRWNNSEIAAELFISVRTVESHIASLRRKLGADTRSDLISAALALRDASVHPPANPLRGRGRDLTTIAGLLANCRWVTLAGAGGVGKTRLALEYARDQSERVPLVVELEHAQPAEVAARITRTLGLELPPGAELTDTLGVALSAQDYLLVLDNADRVGRATADTVRRLLRRAPDLRVIVTSRAPLGDPDEIVHPVRPLASAGVDSPASALLLDRLRAAGSPVADADRATADRICARLDGLPLALELAASVARHLPLAAIEARLAADVGSLDRASPDGRHRSLATAFEWTWDLLTAEDQDVLRRLAALPGTFDFELAAAIAGPGSNGAVLRLLDQSLLIPVSADPSRLRMLAVMREFVLARTDPGLVDEVRRKHTTHTAVIARRFAGRARTDASPEAGRTSAILCPEVNAALRWALSTGHPSALGLATSLSIGVEQYGADVDSITALVRAASDATVLEEADADDLLALGNAIAFVDVDRVTALGNRALSLTTHGDGSSRAAHQLAGLAAAYRGDREVALAHLGEAERLAAERGEDWELGAIRQARGIALNSGPDADPTGALEAFAAAMRAYARADDQTHVNNVRYMMASVAVETDPQMARVWAAECRAYAEAVFNEHEAAHACIVQATLGLEEAGDLEELVDTFRRLGDLRCLNRALLLSADAAPDIRTRISRLAGALEIAVTSGDHGREADTLRALAHAHHDAGDSAAALGVLDRLASLTSPDAASAACPEELRAAYRAEHALV